MHVDDFIDTPNCFDGTNYARWMLMHFRMSAEQRMSFKSFIEDRQLFCTFKGDRYRVTGASRLGDIWLSSDFDRSEGYDHRVDVAECSNWNDSP